MISDEERRAVAAKLRERTKEPMGKSMQRMFTETLGMYAHNNWQVNRMIGGALELRKTISDVMTSIVSAIAWACAMCLALAAMLACFGVVGRAMAWCLGA